MQSFKSCSLVRSCEQASGGAGDYSAVVRPEEYFCTNYNGMEGNDYGIVNGWIPDDCSSNRKEIGEQGKSFNHMFL